MTPRGARGARGRMGYVHLVLVVGVAHELLGTARAASPAPSSGAGGARAAPVCVNGKCGAAADEERRQQHIAATIAAVTSGRQVPPQFASLADAQRAIHEASVKGEPLRSQLPTSQNPFVNRNGAPPLPPGEPVPLQPGMPLPADIAMHIERANIADAAG